MNTEQIDALVWKRDELQKQIKHQKLMVRQKQYKINEVEDHLNHVYDYWRYCQDLWYDTWVKGRPYPESCWREMPDWAKRDCASMMINTRKRNERRDCK